MLLLLAVGNNKETFENVYNNKIHVTNLMKNSSCSVRDIGVNVLQDYLPD